MKTVLSWIIIFVYVTSFVAKINCTTTNQEPEHNSTNSSLAYDWTGNNSIKSTSTNQHNDYNSVNSNFTNYQSNYRYDSASENSFEGQYNKTEKFTEWNSYRDIYGQTEELSNNQGEHTIQKRSAAFQAWWRSIHNRKTTTIHDMWNLTSDSFEKYFTRLEREATKFNGYLCKSANSCDPFLHVGVESVRHFNLELLKFECRPPKITKRVIQDSIQLVWETKGFNYTKPLPLVGLSSYGKIVWNPDRPIGWYKSWKCRNNNFKEGDYHMKKYCPTAMESPWNNGDKDTFPSLWLYVYARDLDCFTMQGEFTCKLFVKRGNFQYINNSISYITPSCIKQRRRRKNFIPPESYTTPETLGWGPKRVQPTLRSVPKAMLTVVTERPKLKEQMSNNAKIGAGIALAIISLIVTLLCLCDNFRVMRIQMRDRHKKLAILQRVKEEKEAIRKKRENGGVTPDETLSDEEILDDHGEDLKGNEKNADYVIGNEENADYVIGNEENADYAQGYEQNADFAQGYEENAYYAQGYGPEGYEDYAQGYRDDVQGYKDYAQGYGDYPGEYADYGQGNEDYAQEYADYHDDYADHAQEYADYGQGNEDYGQEYADYPEEYANYAQGYEDYPQGYTENPRT